MSFRLDKELFIVRFTKKEDSLIMSKSEIQSLLKKEVDRKQITAIRKITIDSMEAVDFKYFKPKSLSPYSYSFKLWKNICEEKCQEQ